MKTDIEIAHEAKLLPIGQIASKIGVSEENYSNYGRYIAKIDIEHLNQLPQNPSAKLILVTAINPTPAGEGKTTTTIGLGDALNKIGAKTMIALREPSLGPCFGTKGGAAGGGYAQIMPMAQINLHFTGDFHAITAAHNLLSAMIDNHIYWGNSLEIDTRRIVWKRVLDANDRALRNINTGLGGAQNGFAREDGFDITVASEIMAIFCLAKDAKDLEERLGNIIIGTTREKAPIYARDLKAHGAMAVLLKDAISPNLVQTLEGNPALVHGGPFANIAHGCNSVIATNSALKLADYIVTEAGFGADLGAEKFLNIKCRKAGLKPSAVVIVATIRALKMHGGVLKSDLAKENIDALRVGVSNVARHVNNIKKFGLPPIVCINHFASDSVGEIDFLKSYCENILGVKAILSSHFANGSDGAIELAQEVKSLVDSGAANFAPLYKDEIAIEEKIQTVAYEIYGANSVELSSKAKAKLAEINEGGYSNLPVCVAKTQYSFSSNPNLLGAPENHTLEVRELRLSAGAGFVVAICGDIMTMPGLPRQPAAENIRLNTDGQIEGLF